RSHLTGARDRWFADSPLEQAGFELRVPLGGSRAQDATTTVSCIRCAANPRMCRRLRGVRPAVFSLLSSIEPAFRSVPKFDRRSIAGAAYFFLKGLRWLPEP